MVRTGRPAAWAGLAATVGGRLVVVAPGEPVPTHPVRPTVLVEDDPRRDGPVTDLRPGHPVLDVLPALTARTAATLRGYDLLVIGRTTQIDALHAGYGTPAQEGRWLARLPADVLALAVPGRVSYLRLYREPPPSDAAAAHAGTPVPAPSTYVPSARRAGQPQSDRT